MGSALSKVAFLVRRPEWGVLVVLGYRLALAGRNTTDLVLDQIYFLAEVL